MKHRSQKHKIKQAKRRVRSVQRARSHYCQLSAAPQTAQPATIRPVRKVLIYESEYAFLCEETLRMADLGLETGGQLFGVQTWDGTLLVTNVIGPGPDAQHNPALFLQDIPFMEREAERIFRIGSLKQIGEWHSHHRLGLSVPSGQDSKSMLTALRMHSEMSQYLLCIAVCDDRFANATPFMYNRDGYETGDLDVIPGESPVRKLLESL